MEERTPTLTTFRLVGAGAAAGPAALRLWEPGENMEKVGTAVLYSTEQPVPIRL